MKITKKIEAEILHVMDEYWGSYLNGDLPTWASFLPDDYRNIGTTKAEIWNSKKEIVDFTEKVLEQTVGLAETRNKKTQIIPYDPYVMVHELGDLYVKAEEGWVFYAPFRLSSLLEKSADGWKILHQHGSYPDAKADEGEAFGFDELRAENKKLRDAIKARTMELELKNQELEIEAALDRIRAKTMAMQCSDELGATSLLLFDELKALGKISEQISIGIFDEENRVLNLYATLHGEQWSQATKVDLNEPHVMQKIYGGWKQNKKSIQIDLSGEKLKSYNRFRSRYSNLSFPNERWVIHCAFFSKGVFSFSTTAPQDEQSMQLLERFAKVFDGTYTRFLDLQKAEAQAREAQIEAALERVRAQTMAMHNSEDVGKCTVKMFDELTALGVDEGTRFGIGILNHENENNQLWTASKDGEEFKMHIGNLDMTLHPLLKSAHKAWKEQVPLHTYVLEGEDLLNYYQALNNAPDYPLRIAMEKLPERQFHYGFVFDHGFFYAFSPREFQADLLRIVQRFSSLFAQTYRRYLDLVKAEEQAREAQIEAALEKVRSRSLAMHKTDELGEVITVVFEKLKDLNFSVDEGIALITFTEGSKDSMEWMYNPDFLAAMKFHLPYFDHPVLSNFWSAKNRGEDFLFRRYTAEESRSFHNHIFNNTDYRDTPEEVKAACLAAETYSTSIAIQKNTSIFINDYSGHTLSENEVVVLKRFSRVFEQAYIRFLDLQRAEAQAREAQIEAAVERVRAEAMAMHSTSDFEKVTQQLLKQVQLLELDGFTGASIGMIDEKEFFTWWDFSSPGSFSDPKSQISQYNAHQYFHLGTEVLNRWKEGANYMVFEYDLEKLHEAVKEWEDINPAIADAFKKAISGGHLTHQWNPCGRLANGLLAFDMVKPPDDDVQKITVKMTHAFEQAYIRFLDLQKAEAQAREAQIEAALERTRAQSMMMQHSDELKTTSHVFHEQLLLLGLPSEFSYVWLPDEPNGTHQFWATWSESLPAGKAGQNGTVTSRSKAITYPLDKTEPYTSACFEMWESDEDVFVNRIRPEEVEGFFSTWSELVGEAEQLKAKNFPDGLYYAEAYMKYGCFGINIRRPLDEAEQEVLRRFANEFERTYTRFLDLQKAEEQARKIKLVNDENERLLHSILPQPIAEQIRTGRQNVVKRFDQVSILFADIVGFTVLSEKLKPGQVVGILNGLFSKFDDLTDQYGLEKIKTIGDAYMVAAGVPEERADHAMTMFRFAQDMLRSLEEYNQANNYQMKIRIGISSGPVVAGVIGKKKFAYDLWGDSVNTAARMEAYGREGKIQVSPTSYELLKNDFSFEKMPGVNIKGKGVMDVYLWQP